MRRARLAGKARLARTDCSLLFSIGKLDKALDEAQAKGSTVVSMKDDWKTIFLPEKNEL